MPAALVAAIDAICVVVFVALGRGAHDEGGAIGGTVRVAAPFLLGLLAAWVALHWLHRRPRWNPEGWRAGILVWSSTLVIGMTARHTLFDRGTAVSFIIVAASFLGLFLVGWRLLAAGAARRRAIRR